MKIAGIYFTNHGQEVARKIAVVRPEIVWTASSRVLAELPDGHVRIGGGLSDWAKERFSDSDAIVFIGQPASRSARSRPGLRISAPIRPSS